MIHKRRKPSLVLFRPIRMY